MATELLNKRSYNAKTFDNADGSFTLEAHIGHVHYKDALGDLVDVDYTIEDMGTYWRMVKANYRLYVAKAFDAPDLIRFDNKFDGRNHSIYFEADSLRWVYNPDLGDMSTFRDAQAVTGIQVGHNVFRYENAFGHGIHFEITLSRSGFRKEVVIDALTDLANPPTPNHRLALINRYRGSGLKVLKRDIGAIDWNENGYYESEEGFHIGEDLNRAYRSWVQPAYAYDSAPEEDQKKLKLKIFWKKVGTALWQAKILPSKVQFQAAVFPVRCDDQLDYYSGTGDGIVGNDTGSGSSFAVCHDAATGDEVDYTNTAAGTLRVHVWEDVAGQSGRWRMRRTFIPFYTESLDDTAVISAALVKIWLDTLVDDDNDAYGYVAICETFQASTSELVVADYQDCGSDNGTAGRAKETPIEIGSDEVNLTGLATGQYQTLTLDATGRGWISKTGWTKLGIREGHDLENVALNSGSNTQNVFYGSQSNYTGTDHDPKLEITYTLPSGGLSKPNPLNRPFVGGPI